VEEVERNLKIMDNTFRYVTVKLEEGVDPASVTEVQVSYQAPKSQVRVSPAGVGVEEEVAESGEGESEREGALEAGAELEASGKAGADEERENGLGSDDFPGAETSSEDEAAEDDEE
jgi:hypothetical protein